jgi:putative hemolysin
MEPLPESAVLLNLILFIIALAFCALCSLLETSITALRLFKLKELAQSSSRYAPLLSSLEQNPNRLLNTILIAGNLGDVTAATLGTMTMESLFSGLPGSIGFTLGICITTAALVIFGEIVPKNIAKIYGERLFASTLWITNILFYALYPLVMLLVPIADTIMQFIAGKHPEPVEYVTSEKEIQFLIDYINEKGLMEPDKTSMLKSVFELGTTPVKEIMVPEPSIVAISSEVTVKEAMSFFTKYQFSRFPVYEGNIDNVVGMLHLKDVFAHVFKDESKRVKDMVRPILFIPENLKVNQLLREFREQHMHIAMVINEFGSIVGLVTLEDVLEEIVGEIRDEYEAVTEKIVPLRSGGWLADATIELDQLTSVLHITFERESAFTLGGFLTERLQHLPKKGERVVYKNFVFQIQQASPKKVSQVLIFENTQNIPETLEI